ncbi:unnamed protein product [Rhizoctonia solani]|uniref:Uncharacterized protein n=1 Tax=Rhizoctonia solani TaxID=456999 RepID=A0A8H3GJI7_9AGAM|nr:unnamed protein product [Rhizoctonia solani]
MAGKRKASSPAPSSKRATKSRTARPQDAVIASGSRAKVDDTDCEEEETHGEADAGGKKITEFSNGLTRLARQAAKAWKTTQVYYHWGGRTSQTAALTLPAFRDMSTNVSTFINEIAQALRLGIVLARTQEQARAVRDKSYISRESMIRVAMAYETCLSPQQLDNHHLRMLEDARNRGRTTVESIERLKNDNLRLENDNRRLENENLQLKKELKESKDQAGVRELAERLEQAQAMVRDLPF